MQVINQEKKDLWYLDSGCSRHMIGDKSKFTKLELKEKGFVTYGDNNKGRILGSGFISNGASFNIHNVVLVEGLKHNLLSISQLCDKGFKVVFVSFEMVSLAKKGRALNWLYKTFSKAKTSFQLNLMD